ncbi:hypothetical protein VOI54_00810 [Tamlana sp. 2201CG12-4]|uniref:hypothetical protein n=1 Tax=Tamlana sp. 2201CG12-4 TaxID=3112582 RepID=UPI002DB5C9E3|nr:hypothetical protein [Tamlana sp. 2201CG12-4]MEC3905547.1 hypothetical protein [Tamlana sp. 2201CG12-4]
MKIEIQLELPFVTRTLDSSDFGVPEKVKFKGTDFTYNSQLNKTTTSALISFEYQNEEAEFNNDLKKKLALRAIELINHYIYHAKTFEHHSTDIVQISPRNTKNIVLEIKDKNDNLVLKEIVELTQEKPKYFQEYFDYLNEPGAFDVFEDLIKDKKGHLLFINLLSDSFYAIFEGRYNESIINSCTAIESLIFPKLIDWLGDKFHNKSNKNAERVLIEIPMNLKYELIFGEIEKGLLSVHNELLEKLKGINKLRNTIVHGGNKATKKQAEDALNYASKFILIVFMKMEPTSFKEEERR